MFSTWANTAFLQEVGSPALHVAVRFGFSAALGLASIALYPDSIRIAQVPARLPQLAIPAACLLAANMLNSLALKLSGITICYVVKSAIPALTVVACVLRGERFPLAVYLTLLPTIVGVALASLSDSEFSMAGLLAAVGSTCAQTALNLTSKQALSRLGLNGSKGQCLLTCNCALAAVPLCLVANRGSPGGSTTPGGLTGSPSRTTVLLAAAGMAYHAEYSLNFAFVRLVSPLAFSVTDVARRLAIILTGAALFRKQLSRTNGMGVGLALGGVLCFLLAASTPHHTPVKSRRKKLAGASR